MYAVIDIETTGGSPVSEKITEIAIFITDGTRIIDEFNSLINPERKIPYYITQLTGITNSMVADAPKFYEIARDIVEITKDTIFVGHNASFDYNFVKNEFKLLGYEFIRDRLCTVNLSRRLIPGKPSYSLGKICHDLNITIDGRHRAAGDALATVELFHHLLKIGGKDMDFIELPGVQKKDLHPNFDPESLKKLPDAAGVYYFFNEKNDLIYIGKSKNLRTRILSHFRNYNSKKAIEMLNEITQIDYELTGNELVALLKESEEIKQHKPKYNRAQRRAISHYGIFYHYDQAGYTRFEICRNSSREEIPIWSFSSQKSARKYLHELVDKYNLCQKLCGLYQSNGACFHHEIMECKGACIGKESPGEYNFRAQKIIDTHKLQYQNFFIVERGRQDEELAVVKICNGKYFGYGYLEQSSYNGDFSLLDDCIKNYEDNRDTQQILRQYLKNGRPIDILVK